MDLEDKIELTATWIAELDNIVVFTGAGVSTDSGLPDYRGPDGVWTRRDKGLPPKPLKVPWDQVKPNEAHYLILELFKMDKLDFLISQNVDGLHIKAGIPYDKIAELHGNMYFMKCLNCGRSLTFEEAGWDKRKWGNGYRTDLIREGQPKCPDCKGRIISSIVNFGDPMPEKEMLKASKAAENADLFFVIGSSLVVSPANSFPIIAKRNNAKLIVLNDGETPIENLIDIRFNRRIGDVLPPIVSKIKSLLNTL
ncbi:MAG: NAD-dependent deacetylase [Promethearchaeota archaeon]